MSRGRFYIEFEIPDLPPSDNAIRGIGYRGRPGSRRRTAYICYTPEADAYLATVKKRLTEDYMVDIMKFARADQPFHTYRLDMVIRFPQEKLLNKGWTQKYVRDSRPGSKVQNRAGERKAKSPYKVLDTLNRRKLVEDAVSEALGIDDSRYWQGDLLKMVAESPEDVGITVGVTRHTREESLALGIPENYLEA